MFQHWAPRLREARLIFCQYEAPHVLTPAELAAHLRVSERTVSRMVAEGCPCMLAGRRPRFDLSRVTLWMEEQASKCRSEKTHKAAGMQKHAYSADAFTDACRRVQVRAMPSALKPS